MAKELLVTLLVVITAQAYVRAEDFAVVGYLPEWRYLQWTDEEKTWRWDALSEHLTHLIIFSIEVGPTGTFQAMDRFPDEAQMDIARAAAAKHGTELLICFGGNSRTNGFPEMVADAGARQRFIATLTSFCREHGLDGVDYNWEYPKDGTEWKGLFTLLEDTRAAFDASAGQRLTITLAYYPDTRQEALLAQSGAKALAAVDLMHMMSYDQHGKHSTWEFGKQSVMQGVAMLPPTKLTMGLPFYSRDVRTGEWDTYEDLVKRHAPKAGLKPGVDQIGNRYFNGKDMIQRKTDFARSQNLGGVMIWEVGQDNFINDIRALDPATSLMRAITETLAENGNGGGDEAGDASSNANTKDEL
eukprot:gene6103-11828_t